MPKVSQQYLDERRDHILAAARRCFVRDGFQATSMQDLFDETGLSSGAVYRYFASKDAMIIAIAEQNIRDVIALAHDLATQQSGTSIGETIARVVETVQAKHAADDIGALAIQVWAECMRNPALADQFAGLMRQVQDELAVAVAAQQRRGEVSADAPAEAVAAVLLAIVPGVLVQLALVGSPALAAVPDALRVLWA